MCEIKSPGFGVCACMFFCVLLSCGSVYLGSLDPVFGRGDGTGILGTFCAGDGRFMCVSASERLSSS